jgi:hypothetical protein
VQVAQPALDVGQLAEQQRPAVAETRDEPAELVTGVGLRDRLRAAGHGGADQQAHALGAAQRTRVEAELGGQRVVQYEQARVRRLVGLPRTAISGSSRAKRSSNDTVGAGATLTRWTARPVPLVFPHAGATPRLHPPCGVRADGNWRRVRLLPCAG